MICIMGPTSAAVRSINLSSLYCATGTGSLGKNDVAGISEPLAVAAALSSPEATGSNLAQYAAVDTMVSFTP